AGRGGLGGCCGRRQGRALDEWRGRETVAHAQVGVDIGPSGCHLGELRAHLAHEHVHGAVAVLHLPTPDVAVDVPAAHHAILALGEDEQDLELAHRQAHATTVHERLYLIGPDLEVAVHQRVSVHR